MGFINKLLSGGATKLVDSVGNAVDRLVTSDEERLQLKNELKKISSEYEKEMKRLEIEEERVRNEELEIRSRIIMAEINSKDKFVRIVRPIVILSGVVIILYLTVLYSLPMLFGVHMEISDGLLAICKYYLAIWSPCTTVYIGARSYEKSKGNENSNSQNLDILFDKLNKK